MFVWQCPEWPSWQVDLAVLQPELSAARLAQGRMLGMAQTLQLLDHQRQAVYGWTLEAVATAQIEGESLPLHSVRASAARRLGLTPDAAARSDPRTEATLDVLEAAVRSWEAELHEETLFAWHAALFPTGRSGVRRIAVGRWRDHAEPMQIVTSRLGKPDLVHYEAPRSAQVAREMQALLTWFNGPARQQDGLVRAALAHGWFEAVHPFEDGNGRIGRALAEHAVAQDMRSDRRLFSLSEQLWQERKAYYAELQVLTGTASLDATRWVAWFVGRLQAAFDHACHQMGRATDRARFHAHLASSYPGLSQAQRKALDKLFEAGESGFKGGLSTEKFVNFTGVSRATAYRDLSALVQAGLLQATGQGRGTRYRLPPQLQRDQ